MPTDEGIIVEIPEAGDPNPGNEGPKVGSSEVQVQLEEPDNLSQLRRELDEARKIADTERRNAEAARRQAQENWQATARANAQITSARSSELESRLSATKIGYSSAKEAAEAKANEAAALQERGDWRAASTAQREASAYEAKAVELEREYQSLEQAKEQQKIEAQRRAQQTPQQQSQDPVENFLRQANASPTLASWVRQHPEFVKDPVVYNTAIAAHHRAVRQGIEVESRDYFDFIEKEALAVKSEKPKSVPSAGKRMPPAAPVSRDSNVGSARASHPKFVKLTPRQVETAEALGMTKERYAEWVWKAQQPDWEGPRFQ